MDLPAPAAKAASFIKEFRDFLLRTNMLALALAVVLGDAAGRVVKVIVSDVLGGLVSVVRKEGTYGWDALNIPLIRGAVIKLGPLLNVVIEFTCVAAVVFIVSKLFIRAAAPPPPPPTKTCDACKEGIHPDATRCKFCTSEQPKVAAAPPPG
jgi:large conductance mechanosensitive channel